MAACTLAHKSRSWLGVIEQFRMIAQKIAHGGLQPAEAEVIPGVVDHGPQESHRPWGFPLGQAVDLRSGRVGQADQLACLVKTFACGIVNG